MKRDTETSSGRSLSCLLPMLKCLFEDAPARLLTAIHFVNSCGSARHYHPPPQRGISARFSSIATLGFVTLGSSVRRFKLTEVALPETCRGALPHAILPPAAPDQEPSLPPNQKSRFQTGFLERPQQRLHAWKNISTQLPTDLTQTIHPLNLKKKKKRITHYIEINQPRGAATL